jgi:hypothetical protein
MTTKTMTMNGVSTCATGQENYEQFVAGPFRGETYHQYDYRHTDGELFSTVKPTLDECRAERDKWMMTHLLRNSARQDIRQNGFTVLWSGDGISMGITFNNLTGKNFTDYDEYSAYVQSRMEIAALKYGEIELVADGVTVASGTIRENL